MQTLKIQAPAKLNLRLDVLGKRPDGYHNILSLMDRINIEDEIHLKIVEKGIEVKCSHEDVPCDDENTAFKALKEILAYSSRNVGIEVEIHKNIPIAAGMGGGSSDAAAVIKGVNELLKLKLNDDKLMKIGAKVGADVPFFLFGAPAYAQGIGDKLSPIEHIPKLYFLIINPGIKVSTKAVYQKILEDHYSKTRFEDLPIAYRTKKDVVKILNNDLELVTIKEFPIIGEIKGELMKNGAIGSQMTGSGSTVFGIFSDKVKLAKAYEKFLKQSDDDWQVLMAENIAA
ncbi:MAG: 4-(cytidine 5'-diphospho)-2-C-methyl-D-erythritol kinase [Deltaproteobacteria bacterium]|nr:4-(cytidine 5'-diphospho)-2-C-methyl-D-erythritol kinase [Deltaproteobacteria bacterium]